MIEATQAAVDAQGQLRLPQARPSTAAEVDRLLFAEDMAELLGSGLTVREALQVMAQGTRRSQDQRILLAVEDRIVSGLSLSEAMSHDAAAFGEVLIALVRAGEQTASLSESLARHARTGRRMEALRSRTMTALVYPALLLGVGLVVLGFLLGWVLPGFADVLKDGSEQLSPLARFILSVGVTLGETRTLWMGVLAGLTVLGGVVLSRPTLRQAAVQRAARLPGLRLTLRLLHASRYFSTVATLTQGGMPAVAALQLATPLLLPEGQRHMAAAVRALQQGQDLARSVSSHAGPRHADVFGDAVVGRLLAVGQRTGALSHTLERIAALLESRTSRRVERWSRSLEPVLMVLLGLLIGGVVLLMYVPLIELSAGMP